MAQQVKPPLATLVSHKGLLVQVLGTPLPSHLHVNVPERKVDVGSSTWILALHAGDPGRVPCFWLLPGNPRPIPSHQDYLESKPVGVKSLPLPCLHQKILFLKGHIVSFISRKLMLRRVYILKGSQWQLQLTITIYNYTHIIYVTIKYIYTHICVC